MKKNILKYLACNITATIILTTTGIISCQKVDKNGDLGGFWKVMEITPNDGEVINKKEESFFWRIQLDLIQIGNTYGRFRHEGDSLFIQMIETDNHQLTDYGLYNAKNERFAVEHLDRNKMILQSESAEIKLKKF